MAGYQHSNYTRSKRKGLLPKRLVTFVECIEFNLQQEKIGILFIPQTEAISYKVKEIERKCLSELFQIKNSK